MHHPLQHLLACSFLLHFRKFFLAILLLLLKYHHNSLTVLRNARDKSFKSMCSLTTQEF